MSCCPRTKKTIKKAGRIVRGFAYAAGGFNNELSAERMKICNNCINKKGGDCTICGCVLIAKTRVPEEFCPINKWGSAT